MSIQVKGRVCQPCPGSISFHTQGDGGPGREVPDHSPCLGSGRATSGECTARNAQSHSQAAPRPPPPPPSLTWNLCTSSRDWLSFWSASRMTSVSLWMMTSRGPCSSIGWLRFNCGGVTGGTQRRISAPEPTVPFYPHPLHILGALREEAGELALMGHRQDTRDEPAKILELHQVIPHVCTSVPKPHAATQGTEDTYTKSR